MADLLVEAKQDLLEGDVELTPRVFESAWCVAWELMIAERAYPHATEHRRQWKAALIACKSEMRAAFLDQPSMFAGIAEALTAAGQRMEVEVTVADLPRAFLGAIAAYGATSDDEAPQVAQEAMRA